MLPSFAIRQRLEQAERGSRGSREAEGIVKATCNVGHHEQLPRAVGCPMFQEQSLTQAGSGCGAFTSSVASASDCVASIPTSSFHCMNLNHTSENVSVFQRRTQKITNIGQPTALGSVQVSDFQKKSEIQADELDF